MSSSLFTSQYYPVKGGPCTAGTWKNWKSSTFGDFAPYLKSRCWIASPTRSVSNQCSSTPMNDHVRSTGSCYATAAEDIMVGQRNSIKNKIHWCKIRPKEYVADRLRWRIIVHQASVHLEKYPVPKTSLLKESSATVQFWHWVQPSTYSVPTTSSDLGCGDIVRSTYDLQNEVFF